MGIGDWDRFVTQARDHLKPGGWLELQEFHLPIGCDDGTMHEGTALWRWGQDIRRGLEKVGIDSLASLSHDERMRAQGLIRVERVGLKIPLGPWAKGRREKKLGIMAQKDLVEGLEGISTKLLLLMGYSQAELTELLDKARQELLDPRIHTYMPL
jgi:hypothetical protein